MKHALNRTPTAADPANEPAPVDQADALRAGADLLRLLNGRADVCLTIDPPWFFPATVDAQVVFGADADGVVEQDGARLDGLLVAMSVLDTSFKVKPWPCDDGVQLVINTVLGGVEVTVWTRIVVPSLVAYVRSWFPDDTEQADPFDREPTDYDLAAIDAEWPLIAAEIAVVDAEAAVALDDGDGLAVRRLSVARRRLSAVATAFEAAGPHSIQPAPAPSSRRRSA